MELMDLYDEDRLPTGRTAERRAPRRPGEYRAVVHVCLFNSRGQLLIQRRSEEKAGWPGVWDVSAAGGVDAGETSRQAAEREFREELGWPLDLGRARPSLTANFDGGFDDFFLTEGEIDTDALTLQREEVSDVRWADRGQVLALLERGEFLPYPRSFLELLFDLRQRPDHFVM